MAGVIAERGTGVPLRAGEALGGAAAREYRMRAVFECGKLDPQVGDTSVLAPFPLVLDEKAWREVAAQAEALDVEALAAERVLLRRADLWGRIGLGGSLARALREAGRRSGDTARAARAVRVSRFDFHWCRDGSEAVAGRGVGERSGGAEGDGAGPGCWRISEMNADVPGGLIEAGPLAGLMEALVGAGVGRAGPDPARALAAALVERLAARGGDRDGVVALVHATGFADDYQVMARVGACAEDAGLRVALAAPDHVWWARDGGARLGMDGDQIAAIVRFYPGEWLPMLGRRRRWQGMFDGGAAREGAGPGGGPVLCNPATALLIQAKRWALVWDEIEGEGVSLAAWRRMLPETRGVREVWGELGGGGWVLKPSLGRVGEDVLVPGVARRDERKLRRAARRHARHWVAQRKFESVPIESPLGPLHVCLGVYVVDGRAAGLYARAAGRALIDQGAWEVPVLIGAAAPAAARSVGCDAARGAPSVSEQECVPAERGVAAARGPGVEAA